MQISGHHFLVTGGSSGLGAATVRRLVAAGAKVTVADLNAQAGEALAAELGAAAHFVATDVTDGPGAQASVEAAVRHFGPLHGLVNCAGVAPAEKVLGRDGPHRLESFARTVQINLVGTFNMARLVAATMAAQTPEAGDERGVIVMTASVAAFEGQIGQAGYAASKGGVVAMVLPLARELARHGIRVLGVAPGIMETPMLQAMPQDVQDALGRMVPYPPRLGQPDEFAQLVEHLIGNRYMNGEVIRLDGAIRMAAR